MRHKLQAGSHKRVTLAQQWGKRQNSIGLDKALTHAIPFVRETLILQQNVLMDGVLVMDVAGGGDHTAEAGCERSPRLLRLSRMCDHREASPQTSSESAEKRSLDGRPCPARKEASR